MTAQSWTHVPVEGVSARVELRIVADPYGRRIVTGLRIETTAEHQITSQTLRVLKLRDLVATTLEGYEADLPEARNDDERRLRDFARTYLGELARQPRRAMSAAADAHGISRATARRWANECRHLGYLPSVARRGDAPVDTFYRSIAAAYNTAATATARPAKVLAEDAGVPVTTVHRWIHEARQRGFLAPAQSQGRAG